MLSLKLLYVVCRVNTDVMFVLDSSGSIGIDNYQTVREYTSNFTEGLLNGNSDSRVGVILYSTTASVEVELDFLSIRTTLTQIQNLRYISSYTNTPEGLCLLKFRPWRDIVSVLRIAVVLTDGRSNRESQTCPQENGVLGTVASTAEQIHSFQPLVTVFAVGVANFVLEELNLIASSQLLVDNLTSFENLQQNQQARSYFICFKSKLHVNLHWLLLTNFAKQNISLSQ